MSAAVRTALAAAANTVTGVRCKAYVNQTTKAGDGYVRLDTINYPQNGFGGICTWQVFVILPNELNAAERWIDSHVDALVAALSEQLIVTSAQPIQLALETGSVPVLAITGNREQE